MLVPSALAIAAAFWIAWLVALAAEKRLLDRAIARWRSLPWLGKCAVALVLAGSVAFAGTKPSPRGRGPADGTPVAGGGAFVLRSVGTDETFDFSPPDGAAVATNWLLHGAATGRQRIVPGDWAFPFGGGNVTDLFAHACGEVRPAGAGPDLRLMPLAAPLGIVPAASWGMVPADGGSLFWHQLTPSNTLLLTWRNALLGRGTNSPVSFQAELRPDGGFAFRYDLSRLPSDGPPADAAIGVRAGGTALSVPPSADLTSLAFASADGLACDAFRDGFAARVGDADPHSFPPGSTNTVLEHAFYSGTTNGAFAYPQPTDGYAVLTVSVSGSGSGELTVGTSFVPLVGRPGPPAAPRSSPRPMPSPTSLSVAVPRGVTCPVYMRGDGTLSVSFSSGDFAFGELPDLSGRHFLGWINFPHVRATEPCIHDYNARRKEVTLPSGAGDLACTWHGTAQVGVENRPPRSAVLTGRFGGRSTAPVSYTLSHPRYLFGRTTYTQTARYCPRPPDDDDGGDGEDGSDGFYGDGDGDDGVGKPCWCSLWDECDGDCWCGCSCASADGDGGQGYPSGEPDGPGPDGYEAARAGHPHMTDVLRLRDPPEFTAPIRLTLPQEHRDCCPCPEHATDWVSAAYVSDRLKVVDAATGTDFRGSGGPVDVMVAGVLPSSRAGDAGVSFAANGEVRLECRYTVLGVGICGGHVPGAGEADLGTLNWNAPTFGLPVPVGTNLWDAVGLGLRTDVRLPSGNIHLGFEDATARFEAWVHDGRSGGFRKLAGGADGPLDVTFAEWRQLVGGEYDPGTSTAWIRVTAAGAGSATLVYRYWAVIGGRFVEDEARQVVTAVAPPVVGDVDRDGDIDATDADLQAAGVPFRFWSSDGPAADGRRDPLDLFPLRLDVSDFTRAWGNAARFRLSADSGHLGFCVLDGLSPLDVAAMQTAAVRTDLGEALGEARLHPLDHGGTNVTSVLGRGGSGGMLAFAADGGFDGSSGPRLVVSLGDRDVFSYRIPVSIAGVDGMYRHLDLRGAAADPSSVPMLPGEPPNMPDDETDGRHFVFVHGYNVNADQSRDWARAMFKRLWWAGSKSKFTAVDWHGDDSQVPVPIVGDVSPNYYINVEHAFMTAAALKDACARLPGEKVMLAHSLGNILVSAAAKDFGLQYSKYYMLNAAVPMEAYDNDASDNLMVDGAWKDIGSRYRASCFYELFSQTPSDFRSKLSWKGRFAGISNAVNCYSPTEDILQNPSVLKAFGMTVGETTGGFWAKQELFKGCAAWYGVNAVTFAGARIEGGWGINANHVANPLAYVPLLGFNASYFADYTRDDLITNPLFTSFNDSRMASTNALNIVDYRLRAKMLGDAIPAESFAAGANPIGGVSGNYNYQNEDGTPNGWPRKDGAWRHSDIKDVSYYYVWKLFEKIKKGE